MNGKSMIARRRRDLEKSEKWGMWIHEIPYVSFPSDCKVKVVPPFGGAMSRFYIQKPDGAVLSIHLQVFDWLGTLRVITPYWEVYPVKRSISSCHMQDVDTLIQLIKDGG